MMGLGNMGMANMNMMELLAMGELMPVRALLTALFLGDADFHAPGLAGLLGETGLQLPTAALCSMPEFSKQKPVRKLVRVPQ